MKDFSFHPPTRRRYIPSGVMQRSYSSVWVLCQMSHRSPIPALPSTVQLVRSSGWDTAAPSMVRRTAMSKHASSRVRFQSQGCSLSSSLYGSQGRTHGTPQRGDYAAPSMMRLAGMGLREKSTHDRRSSKTGACRHPTYVVCKQSMMQWPVQRTARRD